MNADVLGSLRNLRLHGTRRGATGVRTVAMAATVLISISFISAATAQDEEGAFEVRTASSELIDGVHYVSALLDLRLSREATEALDSGVPLTVQIEIDLIRVRRFWVDDEEVDVEQRFVLEYHALTERYLVRNVNRADQASFATVTAALNYLGRIERVPFIDAALLVPGRGYDARIRAELDMDEFSGPLRLLTFWRRDFSLSSDWFRWRLLNG